MSKSKCFKNPNMLDEGPFSYLRLPRPLPRLPIYKQITLML